MLFYFSNIFNRFFLPHLIVGPVAAGFLLCFIVPPHVFRVEGQGLFNFYIEFLIRRARSNWIIYIRESKVGATFLFGILHACVTYGFVTKSSRKFWFTTFQVDKNEELHNCKRVHGDLTCLEYFKQVLYFTGFLKFQLLVIAIL